MSSPGTAVKPAGPVLFRRPGVVCRFLMFFLCCFLWSVPLFAQTGERREVPVDFPPSGMGIPPDAESVPLFMGDEKLMDMIQARILSRKGYYQRSLRLYRSLRERYPLDEEVWEDYIETLMQNQDYEPALVEVGKLLRKNPANLRGQRIQAAVYVALRQYRWAFPVYENILRLFQNDAGIWSDYAYARQDAGEWAPALDYFQRVLELDPDNGNALRNVQTILRTHLPRLETEYTRREAEDDAVVATFAAIYERQLSPPARLALGVEQITIERPQSRWLSAIDEKVSSAAANLFYRPGRDWQARAGIGVYKGMGDSPFFNAGLDWRFHERAWLRGAYLRHQPWYDPVDAAAWEGYFHRGTLALDWTFEPPWQLYLGWDRWDYFIENEADYGQKETQTGIVTRKFSDDPVFSVSYAFYRSRFDYEDDRFRPVEMIEAEDVHSLSAYFEHRPCTYWGYKLSGGIRHDTNRGIWSWFLIPGAQLRLGKRIEALAEYEYSSESRTVADSSVGIFRFQLNVIF